MMTPDTLARIHQAAFTDQRPWSEQEFADFLSDPNVFLAKLENAFALGRVIAGEAELLTLAVDPVSQGKGFGRSVLLQYHQKALEHQANVSFLEVAETNLPARGLYDSSGYAIVGKRPDYYKLTSGKVASALVMSKPISALN